MSDENGNNQEKKPYFIYEYDHKDVAQAKTLTMVLDLEALTELPCGDMIMWGMMDKMKMQIDAVISRKRQRKATPGILVPGGLKVH